MPMDFPDLQSLINAAEVHKFRKPKDGEPEIEYRHALADHVHSYDLIESEEIRNGVGWDRFSESQNAGMLGRSSFYNRSQNRVQYRPLFM